MLKFVTWLGASCLLFGCGGEPSDRDLASLSSAQVTKILEVIHRERLGSLSIGKIVGIRDIIVDSVEKIQCSLESQSSRIYLCDVLVKFEVMASNNSISAIVGFSGKKSQVEKVRLFKSSSGWEIID